MTAAVCPYCRGLIHDADDQKIVCAGCGTPHHADCYQENGGCTVFGCSGAPAEEPKLSVASPELDAARIATGATVAAAPVAPPPPPPGAVLRVPIDYPRSDPSNVLFVPQPVPQVSRAPAFDFEVADENAKSRVTFILLGALLGAFGAHNFYAGYRARGFVQLCITVLTIGLAGPMSWIWAVIDICTITEDSNGVKFRN